MKKILNLRPTEPLLANALRLTSKMDYQEFELALEKDQEVIGGKDKYRASSRILFMK